MPYLRAFPAFCNYSSSILASISSVFICNIPLHIVVLIYLFYQFYNFFKPFVGDLLALCCETSSHLSFQLSVSINNTYFDKSPRFLSAWSVLFLIKLSFSYSSIESQNPSCSSEIFHHLSQRHKFSYSYINSGMLYARRL